MEEKNCTCNDWIRGTEEIDGQMDFCHAHGIKYTGPLFRYCPWCGKRLKVLTKE